MEKGEKELISINENYKIVKRFEGGMSNYTYLIKDEDENKFVYRFPGEGNENFVNFEVEKYNLEKVKNLNIGEGELVLYDIETGIKINKYIPGNNIDEYISLAYVSETLKKLHTSDIQLKMEYNHLERLAKYEKLHSNPKLDEYFTLKEQWLKIFNKYLKKHVKYPAHNDSQRSNIIESETGELHILDWEFSAINDYIYDIATYGNNDFKDALDLLEEYESTIDSDSYIRLYGWRIFQTLQWFNVASFKDETGLSEKLNIDFEQVANNYILEAKKLLKKITIYTEL